MTTPILRVHPSIGIARVGNSSEYYLAPETIAALPIPGESARTGGLPIRPGTEADTIQSSELRDAEGRFKRQAARFRIYQYPADQQKSYPAEGGEEVVIGSRVDGRVVADIIWTVHVANKKACWYEAPDDWGILAYQDPSLGQLVLRNLAEGLDPHNPTRLRRLVIDPGPRTIRGSAKDAVAFDRRTEPSFTQIVGGKVETIHVQSYPVSFPADHFPPNQRLEPQGPIQSLGELQTDDKGRLVVTGGYGRTVAWFTDQQAPDLGKLDLYSLEIEDAVNNDNWFDDTSDGPVHAILVFEDGGSMAVHGGWVITSDPAYAPQSLNTVSLWDDIYDSFVRKLDLEPEIYRDGAFSASYQPSFGEHIQPFFKAAAQVEWNGDLPPFVIAAHRAIGRINAQDNPDDTVIANLQYIRNPNRTEESGVGAPLMPLSLGDSTKSFLSPTLTQYYFLERWADKQFLKGPPQRPLGRGEYLDRASLQNCLGGRFSPGIECTFICRQPELYVTDWQDGAGPFRIHGKLLDYLRANVAEPFLTFGWIPAHPVAARGVEPGDITKFMSVPWHSDYNSCAIHSTSPNPLNSATLYWSWPAQRPVSVYVAADVGVRDSGDPLAEKRPVLPSQRYSVRGPGTLPKSGNLDDAGRFWRYNDMLVHWQDIGVILQATNIDDGRQHLYQKDWYLEVESRLADGPPELADPKPWPFLAGNGTALRKG